MPTGEVPWTEQPASFFVDEGTDWTVGPDPTAAVLYQAAPVRIVATTADGQQLWSRTFSDALLKHVAADHHGGLLVVLGSTLSPSWRPERIRRIDGATGRVTWEYYSHDGTLSEVAVHPGDGRVFVTDELYHAAETYLTALEGLTGIAARWPLPRGHATRYTNGSLEYSAPNWPGATGPIVREDGAVALVSVRTEAVQYRICSGTPPEVLCRGDEQHPSLSEATATLVQLAPGASAPAVTAVDLQVLNNRGSAYRLLPDGTGGLLVAHRTHARVSRLDADLQVTPEVDLAVGLPLGAGLEAEYVLGEGHAYALAKRHTGESARADLIAFAPDTLLVQQVSPVWGAPYVNLRFAEDAGGAQTSGPDAGLAQPNDTLVAGNLLGMWGSGPGVAFAGTHSASSRWAFSRGSKSGTNAIRSYADFEDGALKELALLYPFAAVTRFEYGGLICASDGRYTATKWVTDGKQEAVDVFRHVGCRGNGPAAAHFHTHPPKEAPEPSGCAAWLNISDLNYADQMTGLLFYLAAPKPDPEQPIAPRFSQVFRYSSPRKGESALYNVLRREGGQWLPYTCRAQIPPVPQ